MSFVSIVYVTLLRGIGHVINDPSMSTKLLLKAVGKFD